MGHTIIDRRKQSLGNPPRDRKKAQIKLIVWHYTATNNSNIANHENFWRTAYGWDRGGYMFYIDRMGNIYQNYDYEQKTWGVAYNNTHTVHISVEAATKHDYTDAQIKARDWLTRKMMGDLNLTGYDVRGHWEVYNNSSCPGYNKAEMDAFRRQLAQGEPVQSKPVKPSSDGLYGAKLVKLEEGRFTPTTAIKVRSAPSTKATHTGTLKKGDSINYDAVFEGNGYRWLRYTGNSGNTLYVPYRPSNDVKNQWGTFGEPQQIKYNISVDGYMGRETVRALQLYFKLPADGEIWGQYSGNQAVKAFNQNAVKYGKGGSPVVRALQSKVGATPVDGIWGAGTTRALQRYLGTPVDGEIWRPSGAIKELQRRLKNGTF